MTSTRCTSSRVSPRSVNAVGEVDMRAHILGGLIASCVVLAAGTAVAHHSFAAEFDANKPIKLTGRVTKVEWTNPHVWFYINVKDEKTGEVTNWGAEMGPPHGLQRRGWRRETLKIGEEVTVSGSLAKNGSKRMNARQVTLVSTGGRPGETLDAVSSQGFEPLGHCSHRHAGFIPAWSGTHTSLAGSDAPHPSQSISLA